MKKAPGLSTICISALAAHLAATAPTRAQVPEAGACFARAYDDAHMARTPGQGVRTLRLWFFDQMRGEPDTRSVIVEAGFADQGQGRADGVGGRVLRQTAFCGDRDGARCAVECDGGWFTAAARADGGLEITTTHFAIGEDDGCGGMSNLSEGGRTVYRLAAAPASACADLARVNPLPDPGCYGLSYPQGQPAGMVAGLTLRLEAPETGGGELTFPLREGVLQIALAPGAPGAGALAGTPALIPIWCSASDGLCRSGMDEGHWAVAPSGPEVVLTSGFFALYGDAGEMVDITGGAPARHALRRLPEAACAELVLE